MLEGQRGQEDILEDHKELFKGVDEVSASTKLLLDMKKDQLPEEPEITIARSTDGNEDIEDIEDIAHETEDDDLSLESKEKELIIKALRKNDNKRKYAAKDLGISERTLYRKIKHYDLDKQ